MAVFKCVQFFRRFRIVAKYVYDHHVRPSTGRISVKYDIGYLYENLPRKPEFF
jgi:hypothetical protein